MTALIVVTGASTGIGRATAERMASRGYDVLAGVRTEHAAAQIRGPRITPVMVDVTDAAQIAALRETVGDRRLAGLVNNAGINISGPLEFFPLDELRRQFEVNLFAHVAVTQALLEPLRAGRGRIVNIGSVGARTPLPFTAPYAASKAALWATGEALRAELRPWGIHVATVEPGAIATEIWGKISGQTNALTAAMPDRGKELYGTTLAKVDAVVQNLSSEAMAPDRVAQTIEHALTSPRPRERYLVGRDARRQTIARRVLGFRRFDRLLEKRMGI